MFCKNVQKHIQHKYTNINIKLRNNVLNTKILYKKENNEN